MKKERKNTIKSNFGVLFHIHLFPYLLFSICLFSFYINWKLFISKWVVFSSVLFCFVLVFILLFYSISCWKCSLHWNILMIITIVLKWERRRKKKSNLKFLITSIVICLNIKKTRGLLNEGGGREWEKWWMSNVFHENYNSILPPLHNVIRCYYFMITIWILNKKLEPSNSCH